MNRKKNNIVSGFGILVIILGSIVVVISIIFGLNDPNISLINIYGTPGLIAIVLGYLVLKAEKLEKDSKENNQVVGSYFVLFGFFVPMILAAFSTPSLAGDAFIDVSFPVLYIVLFFGCMIMWIGSIIFRLDEKNKAT